MQKEKRKRNNVPPCVQSKAIVRLLDFLYKTVYVLIYLELVVLSCMATVDMLLSHNLQSWAEQLESFCEAFSERVCHTNHVGAAKVPAALCRQTPTNWSAVEVAATVAELYSNLVYKPYACLPASQCVFLFLGFQEVFIALLLMPRCTVTGQKYVPVMDSQFMQA